MTQVVPLEKALDEKLFGSKAVGLGQALRDGVPVPKGIALSGAVVEAVAAGEERAIRAVDRQARPLLRCAPPPPTRTAPKRASLGST